MSESEYERRQRERAQLILRNAMPDLTRVLREIRVMQSNSTSLAKIYTPEHQQLIAAITQNMPKIDLGLTQISRDLIPALKLDYSTLFPQIGSINKQVLSSLAPSIKIIQDFQRNQFADIIASARRARSASLPPNWRRDDVQIPTDLEVLLLDEGLPLAWVPPTDTAVELFAAGSRAERRRILGNRWRGTANACVAELRQIQAPELAEHVEFAIDAAETLLAGRHKAAQALSANLLDTVLRQSFNSKDLRSITGRKQRFDIEDYPVRVAIVLGGIWGSYGEFWTSKGDKIPREYSRHGSAHGVSRRQYSRINSLLALMHVVSLLRLIESDLS